MVFSKLSQLLAALLATSSPACALTGQQISDGLSHSLSPGASIYLPSNTSYTMEVKQRWNEFNPPTYVVAIKPATGQDVQTIIKYASKNSVPFLVTGGGHGYSTTLAAEQNGIELDMSNFNSVVVDADKNTMTIGGATLFSQVTPVLQAAHKEITTGSCSCVGMVGATLGGGIGPYGGLHGLISDSLLSVEMVTGNGSLMNVSSSSYPGLFWGMKGAGFNFGAVVSATYKIYDETNGGYAMNADMIFPGALNGSLWEIAKSFQNNQPAALALDYAIGYDASSNGAILIVNAIYVGSVEEGKALIAPLLNLNPIVQNITSIRYQDVEDQAIFGNVLKGCTKGNQYTSYSLNLYNIDVPSLISVTNYINTTIASNPALGMVILALSQFAPQGAAQYDNWTSSYPYRKTVIYANLQSTFPAASDYPAVDALGKGVRKLLQLNNPTSNGQVYVLYAHGDEGPAAWYSEANLPVLRVLKSLYDPKGLFSFYNSL